MTTDAPFYAGRDGECPQCVTRAGTVLSRARAGWRCPVCDLNDVFVIKTTDPDGDPQTFRHWMPRDVTGLDLLTEAIDDDE